MEEIWKDIQGYEGLYQVSNFGRIKSLSRLIFRKNGNNYSTKEIIMTLVFTKNKYLTIKLRKGDSSIRFFIHRLVAKAFIPNPEMKKQINHLDGNKTNNLVSNLVWSTQSENIRHAFENGLNYRGEDSINAKLTEQQVKYIKHQGGSTSELALNFGVSKSTISEIKSGRNWKHI